MLKIYISLFLAMVPMLLLGQGFKGKTVSITPHVGLLYIGPDRQVNNGFTGNIDIEKVFNRSLSAGLYGFGALSNKPIASRGSLSGFGYGFFLRNYIAGRGSIAPLGPFVQYGASLQNYVIFSRGVIPYSGMRTYAFRLAVGFNWFLSKSVLIFGAIEGKYEAGFDSHNLSILGSSLNSSFENVVLETMPVAVKLGITIPLF